MKMDAEKSRKMAFQKWNKESGTWGDSANIELAEATWVAACTAESEDVEVMLAAVVDDATKGMEDVIVNFAKTGKLSFDQLLQTIAEDILRSQIKQLFANLFSAGGMTGGTTGGGSLFGTFGKMLGFADGGVIGTNAPVLVGERGPEIISGAAGKTVTPNNAMGTHVTYNINAVDSRSFQQMVAQDPSFIYAVTLRGQNMIPGGGFR